MQLSDWLRLANLSQKNFAQKLGVSPPVICRLVNGSQEPSIDLMDRIEQATNGAVRYEDWKQHVATKKVKSLNGV